MMFQLGDFVTVLHPSGDALNGSGRVIDRDESGYTVLYAIERDDMGEVTWHGEDELSTED